MLGVGPCTGGWVAAQNPHTTHRMLAFPPQHPSDANSSSERGGISWAPAPSIVELSDLSLHEPCAYTVLATVSLCVQLCYMSSKHCFSADVYSLKSPTVLPCLLPQWASNLYRKGYDLDIPFRHCLGNHWFPVSGVSRVSALRQASSPGILFPEDPSSLAEGRIFRQRSNTEI